VLSNAAVDMSKPTFAGDGWRITGAAGLLSGLLVSYAQPWAICADVS
jgi:hypothetical protein